MSTDDSSSNFVDSDVLDEQDDASAADEYDDDAFDDYSDAFESDGDSDDDQNAAAGSSASVEDASSARVCEPRFALDERVQVYWKHECEWFSGTVTQLDDSSDTQRYYVEYDDGEAQWETNERMRCSPETAGVALDDFQQLQLRMRTLTSVDRHKSAVFSLLLHAKVLVYWRDSMSWFVGSIAEVDVQARTLRVEYDDGDERWEHERDFVNILVHLPSSSGLATHTSAGAQAYTTIPAQQSGQPPPPPSPVSIERVLTARAYTAIVERHFQPERTPRPYVSVTTTIGSILTPRTYCERRYLHAKLACTSETTDQRDNNTRDVVVQTDILGAIEVEQQQHVYSPCC